MQVRIKHILIQLLSPFNVGAYSEMKRMQAEKEKEVVSSSDGQLCDACCNACSVFLAHIYHYM